MTTVPPVLPSGDQVRSVREQRAEQPLYVTRIKVYPRKVEGLFRRITQAKLAESDGAEGAHQPKTTNEVAVAGPATTGADADSGMMTRLSRFTTHGVKRFSLTRLFKGRTTN